MTTSRCSVRLASAAVLWMLLVIAACAPAVSVPPSEPRPDEPRLPPVPEVLGELGIDVVYPAEGATITSRDSTFVFGSVGRGDASLTINGTAVEVAPNGAWLAYLPVPPDGVYQVAASAEGQAVSETRTVQVPAPAAAPPGAALAIVSGSVTPSGVQSVVRGEEVAVSFRGTPGGSARLVLPDGRVVPLVERRAVERSAGFMLDQVAETSGVAEYAGRFEVNTPLASGDSAVDMPMVGSREGYLEASEALADGGGAYVELAQGGVVVHEPVPAAIALVEPSAPRVAVGATERPDATVVGRRGLGADQAWDFFWPNGTRFAIDGEAAGFYRVRLAPDLSAWVSAADVQLQPEGTPSPEGFVGPSIQLTPHAEWTDVRFAMSDRLPFRVEPGEFGLAVTFYGATGRPAYLGYGAADDFVHLVDWDQPLDGVFRFDIQLNRPLWGFRYHWEGDALIVQVRRSPAIDPTRPLAGVRVGVDAGHRASGGDTGAIGPTRLLEVDANLDVIDHLVPMLENAGAEIVHIRTDTLAVPLIDRPIHATRSDAHLLVSVHFNAFPDGVNPFENHGTINFYYWPHSLPFARALQREILAEIGLPDRGVRFQNLAMPRTMWMPSVLTETLFLMFPDQEAALRDPAFVERVAAAHFRAMESFVRDRATLRAVRDDG